MQMTGSNHKNMIPPQCQSLNLSILMFFSCLVWQGTFHANKNFNKPNSFPYSKKTKWAPSIFSFSCYKNYDCLKVFYVTTLITVFENHRKSLIQHCEASYVYNLSGQKFIRNAKNGPIWRVLQNLKIAVKKCYQTSKVK